MEERVHLLFKMKNYFNFKNKKVLIMGGSSGFGAKIAETFNDLESKVWITGRNTNKLKKVKNRCKNKSINFASFMD